MLQLSIDYVYDYKCHQKSKDKKKSHIIKLMSLR